MAIIHIHRYFNPMDILRVNRMAVLANSPHTLLNLNHQDSITSMEGQDFIPGIEKMHQAIDLVRVLRDFRG